VLKNILENVQGENVPMEANIEKIAWVMEAYNVNIV